MNTNLFIDNAYYNAPNKTGLVCQNRSYSYREIRSQVNRLTNVLKQLGGGPGKRIGVLSENRPEMVFLYYACARLNAVFIPIVQTESKENIISMITHVQCEYLFVDNKNLKTCISIQHSLDCVRLFISFEKRHASYMNYQFLMDNSTDEYFCAENDDNDPTAILFTSGTTGTRKAVAFSHLNFIRHTLNFISNNKNITAVLSFMSFSHILGFQVITVGFYNMHKIVICEPEPETILRLIEKEKIDGFCTSLNVISGVVRHPHFDSYDLSSLKYIEVTGDSSYASFALDLISRLPEQVQIQNVYGLTELTYDIAVLDAQDHNFHCPEEEKQNKMIRLNSIGRPLKPAKLIITDRYGNQLEHDQIGEVVVHTDCYMIGYVSQETHEIEEQNEYWFDTDDIGYQDEDGYIFLVGKNMIDFPGINNLKREVGIKKIQFYPVISQLFSREDGEIYNDNSYLPMENENVDYIRLFGFLRNLFLCGSMEELIHYYLAFIADFIPASSFAVHLFFRNSSTTEVQYHSNILKWSKTPIREKTLTFLFDYAEDGDRKTGKCAVDRQLLSIDEYIQKYEMEYIICSPLFSADRRLIGILSFAVNDGHYELINNIHSLIFYISNTMCIALGNIIRMENMQHTNIVLENIVDVSPYALLVLDEDCEVVLKSRKTEALLGRLDMHSQTEVFLRDIRNHVREMIRTKISHMEFELFVPGETCQERMMAEIYEVGYSMRYFLCAVLQNQRVLNKTKLREILTEQEMNIALLIVEGYRNKEIAARLFISVNTVKYHLKNMFLKFGVSSRAELVTKLYEY